MIYVQDEESSSDEQDDCSISSDYLHAYEEGKICMQSESEAGPSSTGWTARRVVMFSLLSFVYFLTWCCLGIWSPFFPSEAEKLGVSQTEVGFIFGIYSLIAFFTALIYGPILVPYYGPYFVLFVGLFLNGGANLICGFVNLIHDPELYGTFCFLVRAVGAIGGSGCETAIVVIVTGEFRENLSTAIGLLRIFTGLGFMIGPVLGGFLFSVGGFRLPFLVTGGSLLLSLPLIWWLLPRREHEQVTSGGMGLFMKTLKIPGLIVINMSYLVGILSITFLEPTLEPHARTFAVDPSGVGLLFLCLTATYMISSPIFGYILDYRPWNRIFVVIGSFATAFCILFYGPAPFLTQYVPVRTVWVLALALALCGISVGLYLIPVLPELLLCCYERGLPRNFVTDSLVSGYFTGFANLGAFLGPVLGGMLTQYYGFPWTSVIISIIIAAQAVFLLLFLSCNRRRSLPSDASENKSLITENKTDCSIETGYGSIAVTDNSQG